MNKKLIYLGVIVLAVVLLLFVMWPTNQTKASNSENEDTPSISNDDLLDLVQNYNAITDYNQRVMVWRELFKTCSAWNNYYSSIFSSEQSSYDRSKELGMTLDDYFTAVAITRVENGDDILSASLLCEDYLGIIENGFSNTDFANAKY